MESQKEKGHVITLVMGLLLLHLLLGSSSLLYPFGRDQAEYAELGDLWRQRGEIYCRVVSVKPPGTHLIHALALALFGHSMLSIRLLDFLLQYAVGLSLVTLLSRVGASRRLSLVAASVYWLAYYSLGFWGTAQTEGFQVVPLIGCLLVLARFRFTVWSVIASGLLLGGAMLFKYPLAIALPCISLVIWREERRRPLGPRLGLVICFVGAAFLPLLAFLGSLAHADCLENVLQLTVGYYREYMQLPFPAAADQPGFSPLFARWLSALTLGVGLCGLILPIPAQRRRTARLVAALAIAASIQVVIQGKFYPHHAIVLLPFLVLLPPLLISVWAERAGFTRGLAVGLLLVPVFYLGPAWYSSTQKLMAKVRAGQGLAQIYASDQFGSARQGADFSSRSSLELAGYLRTRTAHEGGCRLFVWGFEPGAYFSSGCRPASRFLYNFLLFERYRQLGGREELLQDLRAAPPDYVVIAQNDRLPWVTGSDNDSFSELSTFPGLRSLLDQSYEHVTTIDDFIVLERKDRVATEKR